MADQGYVLFRTDTVWEMGLSYESGAGTAKGPVFGERLKLRKEVEQGLEDSMYITVDSTLGDLEMLHTDWFKNPICARVVLCRAGNAGILTEQEKEAALLYDGEYYFAALEGEMLSREYYAILNTAFLEELIECGYEFERE